MWVIGGHDATRRAHVGEHARPSTPRAGTNVYAHDGANALSPVAPPARSLVYVPNSLSNTVDVIDPTTMQGDRPLRRRARSRSTSRRRGTCKTLYVDNDHGNSLTPIDPNTGQPRGPPIPVTDPYNLYFTPDGRYAIVVAEARQPARLSRSRTP